MHAYFCVMKKMRNYISFHRTNPVQWKMNISDKYLTTTDTHSEEGYIESFQKAGAILYKYYNTNSIT